MSNFVILLVEDDALQRGLVAEILMDENFEVIECATAEVAELVVASLGTELRALITDNNLAGSMLGKDLAAYAKRRYPHLNVIITSGQQVNPLPYNITLLRKPFLPTELLEVARA